MWDPVAKKGFLYGRSNGKTAGTAFQRFAVDT